MWGYIKKAGEKLVSAGRWVSEKAKAYCHAIQEKGFFKTILPDMGHLLAYTAIFASSAIDFEGIEVGAEVSGTSDWYAKPGICLATIMQLVAYYRFIASEPDKNILGTLGGGIDHVFKKIFSCCFPVVSNPTSSLECDKARTKRLLVGATLGLGSLLLAWQAYQENEQGIVNILNYQHEHGHDVVPADAIPTIATSLAIMAAMVSLLINMSHTLTVVKKIGAPSTEQEPLLAEETVTITTSIEKRAKQVGVALVCSAMVLDLSEDLLNSALYFAQSNDLALSIRYFNLSVAVAGSVFSELFSLVLYFRATEKANPYAIIASGTHGFFKRCCKSKKEERAVVHQQKNHSTRSCSNKFWTGCGITMGSVLVMGDVLSGGIGDFGATYTTYLAGSMLEGFSWIDKVLMPLVITTAANDTMNALVMDAAMMGAVLMKSQENPIQAPISQEEPGEGTRLLGV